MCSWTLNNNNIVYEEVELIVIVDRNRNDDEIDSDDQSGF